MSTCCTAAPTPADTHAEDQVLATVNPEPSRPLPSQASRQRIDEMLRQALDAQEMQVLTLCFGLDGSAPLSHAKVGARLGLSADQVEQVQSRALGKLRRPMLRQETVAQLN
jgi:RNA polymerase primary sigma factor